MISFRTHSHERITVAASGGPLCDERDPADGGGTMIEMGDEITAHVFPKSRAVVLTRSLDDDGFHNRKRVSADSFAIELVGAHLGKPSILALIAALQAMVA